MDLPRDAGGHALLGLVPLPECVCLDCNRARRYLRQDSSCRRLLDRLSDEQRDSLATRGQFAIRGSLGGEWLIAYGRISNVARRRFTQWERRCFILEDGASSNWDHMLAQKMWIEGDELTVRRVAC